MLESKLGEFKLNTKYGFYEMVTDNYTIQLDLDEESDEECEKAFLVFKKYEEKMNELDNKFRRYAASNMLEMANDWLSDASEEPITADVFMKRISNPLFIFHNDGCVEAYYEDDDIFWGHVINVMMDELGEVNYADIAG